MKVLNERTQFNQEFTLKNYLGMLSQNYNATILEFNTFISGAYYHIVYWESTGDTKAKIEVRIIA